jgi:GTP cyclohydrolase I
MRIAAGAKARLSASEEEKSARQKRLSNAVREILECLGEDPDREGLKGTPDRYAQAMLYFTKGYEESMKGTFRFGGTTYKRHYQRGGI